MNTLQKILINYCLLMLLTIFSNFVIGQESHDDHDHQSESHDHGDHETSENITEIADDMAEKVGIEVEFANSGVLQQTIVTYGKLNTSPEQVSHVFARFPGVVTSVQAKIGEQVEAGTLLAEVESNDSLIKYPVKAPIAGLITTRHANVGEVTQDQMLFEIASFNPLWAELRVFPSQQEKIKSGQKVFILLNNKRLEAIINHILPARDGHPFFIARVALENADNSLSPGLMAEGQVVTDQFSVPLLVKKTALQTMNSLEGVFVKEGESYEFRALRLGRSDSESIEVLDGITSGESYVSKNSYLIKADIEKSTAEHHH